jgi:RNA polymerase sigma-70 factor (ECF subfamily)
MSSLEDSILKNLKAFVAFARKRLNDPHLAEDVVQDSLVKALTADHKPLDEEATVAWFYRILRRSIIDLYRRRDAQGRALKRFEQELSETPGVEEEQILCQCFTRLLPLVPERYRELLQQVDLEGKKPEEVASQLGLTRNNLTVRLHRARKHLREALAQNCRACSIHGCLDCTCGESPEGSHCH